LNVRTRVVILLRTEEQFLQHRMGFGMRDKDVFAAASIRGMPGSSLPAFFATNAQDV
jgi:hypothetical protein